MKKFDKNFGVESVADMEKPVNMKYNKGNEIHFGYSRPALFVFLWFSFTLIGLIPLYFIGANNLAEWMVAKYDAMGLLSVVLFAIVYMIGLMLGAGFLSARLTNKKGQAHFLNDYVEITLGNKKFNIPYSEISEIKCTPVFLKHKGITGYHFKLKAKKQRVSIRTSKEDWQRNKQKQHRRYELQALYDMLCSCWKRHVI